MKKNFILDPHVLLYAPYALFSFEDNDIYMPTFVLDELDRYKNAEGEIGANAREAIKTLEKIQLKGDFTQGISLGHNMGHIFIKNDESVLNGFNKERIKDVNFSKGRNNISAHNQIIRLCMEKDADKMDYAASIIVTNDSVLRIKARIHGLNAQEFTTDKIEGNHSGRAVLWVPDETIDALFTYGEAEYKLGYTYEDEQKKIYAPTENEFLELHSELHPNKTALGVFRHNVGQACIFRVDTDKKWIQPKNAGQTFIQYALQDEEIPLVIVKGPAGTGKTLIALAEGLNSLQNRKHKKILICRPNAQFDDDIGFLPGSEQEKISPLMRSIADNLEYLLNKKKHDVLDLTGILNKDASLEEVMSSKIFAMEALNFIRGRSISKTWIIIDEAQNLTPKQAKGIITRAGFGSKIILLGDPEQIDNYVLNRDRNGLTFAAETMRGSKLCAQITLTEEECVRSELAKEATLKM